MKENVGKLFAKLYYKLEPFRLYYNRVIALKKLKLIFRGSKVHLNSINITNLGIR